MKKFIYLLLMLLAVFLTACGSREEEQAEYPQLEDGQIYAFFTNADKTDVYPVAYTIEDKNVSDIIRNMIQFLMSKEKTADYQHSKEDRLCASAFGMIHSFDPAPVREQDFLCRKPENR